MIDNWRVRGSYFEGCNCEAICPCRAVGGQPGGPSSYGVCFGALSWKIDDGFADDIDLTARTVVMILRYRDEVQPATKWEVRDVAEIPQLKSGKRRVTVGLGA